LAVAITNPDFQKGSNSCCCCQHWKEEPA